MNNFDLKHIASFLTIALVITYNTSEVFAAGKGLPESSERGNWCYAQLSNCINEAKRACQGTYGNSTDTALCESSEVVQCKNSYGSTSDCLTRIRANPNSNIQERIDNTEGVVVPVDTNPSPKDNRLKRKQINKATNSINAPKGSK